MKFILIMSMCSLLHQECIPDFKTENQIIFEKYSDCQVYGNRVSINILESLGDKVDTAKIKIFFKCAIITEEEEKQKELNL